MELSFGDSFNRTVKHMKTWLKRLLCKHKSLNWIRNIYGDEIILRGYKRSAWRCEHCDKIFYKNKLESQQPPVMEIPPLIKLLICRTLEEAKMILPPYAIIRVVPSNQISQVLSHDSIKTVLVTLNQNNLIDSCHYRMYHAFR